MNREYSFEVELEGKLANGRTYLITGMAVKAIHLFPQIVGFIKGVGEFKTVSTFGNGPGRPLLDDRVADLAIAGNNLSFLGFMPAVVAAEASRRSQMPDIFGINIPAGLHFRKKILTLKTNNFLNGLFYVTFSARVKILVFFLIKFCQIITYRGLSFFLRWIITG